MSEFTYERLKENLERLKMKNTLEIIDNYLEQALKDKVNVVEILDHIFSEEAKSKNRRAVEKQIQMSGFPIKKGFAEFDFAFQPSIDKQQIDELCTMRFLESAAILPPSSSGVLPEWAKRTLQLLWEWKRQNTGFLLTT